MERKNGAVKGHELYFLLEDLKNNYEIGGNSELEECVLYAKDICSLVVDELKNDHGELKEIARNKSEIEAHLKNALDELLVAAKLLNTAYSWKNTRKRP